MPSDLREMAREWTMRRCAVEDHPCFDMPIMVCPYCTPDFPAYLTALLARVRDAERERCAEIAWKCARGLYIGVRLETSHHEGDWIAAAIRKGDA